MKPISNRSRNSRASRFRRSTGSFSMAAKRALIAASIASALWACSAAALSASSFARWIRSDRSRSAASLKVGRSICPVDKAKRALRPPEFRNASAKEVSVSPASIFCKIPFNRAPTSAAPGKSSTRYFSAKPAWDDPAIKKPAQLEYRWRQACLQAGMQRKKSQEVRGICLCATVATTRAPKGCACSRQFAYRARDQLNY